MLSRYNSYKYKRLGIKLGFSIGQDVFGYGLVIPHYGTIVVGGTNRIGNYAVLHTSSCITDKAKIIGDGLYLSTGAKIITGENIGDGVTVAANSVLTQGIPDGYALYVGVPAKYKAKKNLWFKNEYDKDVPKVQKIQLLKQSLDL